jgi:hypothetical protein
MGLRHLSALSHLSALRYAPIWQGRHVDVQNVCRNVFRLANFVAPLS